MNEAPRKTPVTLEDLLRFKRAEQPPPEFWADFERGLRTKQLAAIVEPRPWWAPLIRIGSRVARYQLPVGVTAILAITLLTVREYGPVASSPVLEPTSSETATVEIAAPVQERAAASAEAGPAPAVAASVASSPVAQSAPAVAATALHAEPVVAHAASARSATAVGTVSHLAMVNPELSSARYIADNLAAAQRNRPEVQPMLGQLATVDAGNPLQDEPLAQINLSGESRSQRLLAGMAWAAAANTGDSALRANEHTARRLSERRLSESDVISRLDVGGNRVTVKF